VFKASPRSIARLAVLTGLAAASVAFAADPYAVAPPYARPIAPGTVIRPLITTGQQVPLLGGAPGATYRFPGIPDGLGMVSTGPGTATLYSNHELTLLTSIASGPLASGARISELHLNVNPVGPTASVVEGHQWISNVYAGEPPVLVAPGTAKFTRFCSSYLGGPWSGLDRPMYFTGEEVSGAATFDGKGGSATVTVGGDLYTLPRMGHANWENLVVQPGTGTKTVIFGTEDGSGSGTGLNSHFWMYVGTKNPGAGDALSSNGLNNGQLYVLVAQDAVRKNEATFGPKGTSVPVAFAAVNYNQTDAQLAAQANGLGSFNFVRCEDNAYSKTAPGVSYFVTTGTPGTSNPYGRLYRLNWNVNDPAAGPTTLTLLLDGSEGIVSPDNIDLNSRGQMMICEDPNYNLGIAPLNLTRDTYLWLYDTNTTSLIPVLEMDRPSQISHALAADPLNTISAAENLPGFEEFSGVIDAEPFTGLDTWLVDVQAHALRINPAAETVEGGQIMLISLNNAVVPTQNTLGADMWLDGDVLHLGWSIGERSDLDGFRVERSNTADGVYTNLTPTLVSAGVTSFSDTPGAGTWFYRVEAVRGGVIVMQSSPVRADIGGKLAAKLAFRAPSPNPSNGQVSLSFSVPSDLDGTQGDVKIFDLSGREVATVFSGRLTAGQRAVAWDGRDAAGQLHVGVFYARIATVKGSATTRLVRVGQ
jgi:hypothetical protein